MANGVRWASGPPTARDDEARRPRVTRSADGKTWLVTVPLEQAEDALSALTPSERSVLRALVRGGSNELIAAARRTSVRTVANQLASILAKTGARSRYELIARFAGAAIEPDAER